MSSDDSRRHVDACRRPSRDDGLPDGVHPPASAANTPEALALATRLRLKRHWFSQRAGAHDGDLARGVAPTLAHRYMTSRFLRFCMVGGASAFAYLNAVSMYLPKADVARVQYDLASAITFVAGHALACLASG